MEIITRFERSTVPWLIFLEEASAFGDDAELAHSSRRCAKAVRSGIADSAYEADGKFNVAATLLPCREIASGVLWRAFGDESGEAFGMVRVVA